MSYNVLNNVSFIINKKNIKLEQHLRHNFEQSVLCTDVTKMFIQ